MSNRLQKKFQRSERKSAYLPSNKEDPSGIIQRIKALNKYDSLPPPLPIDVMVSDFKIFVNEISRTLKLIFEKVTITDDFQLFNKSCLTIDFLYGLVKQVANHNFHSIFPGDENSLVCDIKNKDIYFRMQLKLASYCAENLLIEYVTVLEERMNEQLLPYGSISRFSYVNDLILNKSFLIVSLTVNRLENFSISTTSEVENHENVSRKEANV